MSWCLVKHGDKRCTVVEEEMVLMSGTLVTYKANDGGTIRVSFSTKLYRNRKWYSDGRPYKNDDTSHVDLFAAGNDTGRIPHYDTDAMSYCLATGRETDKTGMSKKTDVTPPIISQ
jgi:hypothetical protein